MGKNHIEIEEVYSLGLESLRYAVKIGCQPDKVAELMLVLLKIYVETSEVKA